MSDENYQSKILPLLRGYFRTQNPNISVTIDGHNMTVSNLKETDMKDITLPTNTPEQDAIWHFESCEVFLDGDDSNSFKVPGLDKIIKKLLETENSKAYMNGEKTFKPFANKIKNRTFNELVDELSGLTNLFANTRGAVKKYRWYGGENNQTLIIRE